MGRNLTEQPMTDAQAWHYGVVEGHSDNFSPVPVFDFFRQCRCGRVEAGSKFGRISGACSACTAQWIKEIRHGRD